MDKVYYHYNFYFFHSKVQDKALWEQREKERIEKLIEDRELAVKCAERLKRMADDKNAFLEKLKSERKNVYLEKLKDFEKRLDEERKKRLAERRQRRKEERREKQAAAEKKRLEEEERRKQREEEEKQEKLRKMREDELYRYLFVNFFKKIMKNPFVKFLFNRD